MAEFNPELPPITIYGAISGNPTGKDKYNINDETGLGPNGADKFISYDIVISNIQGQSVGDASVRNSQGLNTGGTYNGEDIKVGDYVATQDGQKILKISDISVKASSFISCSVEDVGMTLARTRSDRNNIFSSGDSVFKVDKFNDG